MAAIFGGTTGSVTQKYPVGQKFCRNPTGKFYEENGFKKYSYISIVLYVYLMSLYFKFVFCIFCQIQYDPQIWEGEIFTLRIENFDDIALSRTVKEIKAVLLRKLLTLNHQ